MELMVGLNDNERWAEDDYSNLQVCYPNDNADLGIQGVQVTQVGTQVGDQLLSLYYLFFHPGHPYLIPQHTMKQYLAMEGEALEPLLAVIQYVGSLFAPSIPSGPLNLAADRALATARLRGPAVTAFDLQAALLYSIAVYWSDEPGKANELLDWVTQIALDQGMNRRAFASENGRRDPILEESWRRTWWQIYITGTIIAGSEQTYPHRITTVDVDVQLPCDEQSYESGVSYVSSPLYKAPATTSASDKLIAASA
jgi:hypothetical protein